MQKKMLWAVILALVVLMTACSSGEDAKQPASVNGDSSVISQSETVAENPDSVEETSGPVEDESATEIAVAETVLYEADGIKVTVTGYEDGWMGPEIKMLVENDSTKNVLVTADAVSVNGYMMPSASLYAEVAAGKKANESLDLMTYELEQAGIDTVAELQFYINVSDAETWETMDISELLTLNTSAAPYEQSVDDSGDILYESKGIKIVCKGLKQDIIWDGTVVFYMENNSGKAITIYAENVSVNGYMQDVGMWSDLRPETKLIDGMSMIDLSDLEIEDIDQIENIEFNLSIIDANTWEDIEITDVLTLNFE